MSRKTPGEKRTAEDTDKVSERKPQAETEEVKDPRQIQSEEAFGWSVDSQESDLTEPVPSDLATGKGADADVPESTGGGAQALPTGSPETASPTQSGDIGAGTPSLRPSAPSGHPQQRSPSSSVDTPRTPQTEVGGHQHPATSVPNTPNLQAGHVPPQITPHTDVPPTQGNDKTPNLQPGQVPPQVTPHTDVPPTQGNDKTPNLQPGQVPPQVTPHTDVPPTQGNDKTPNLQPGQVPPQVTPHTDVPPTQGNDKTPNLQPGQVPSQVTPHTDVPPTQGNDKTPNLQPDHVPPQVTPHTDVPPTQGNDKTPNLQPDHVPPQVTPHTDVPPTQGNDKTPNLQPGHVPSQVTPHTDVPPTLGNNKTPNLQPDHVPPQATPHTDVPPTLGNDKTPNLQPDHVPPQATPHTDVPPTLGNDKTPNIQPDHVPPQATPHTDVPPTLGNDKTPNIQPDHVPPQVTPHTDVPPTLGNNKTPNIQPDHVPPQATPHTDVPPTLGNNKTPNIQPDHVPPQATPHTDVPPTLGNNKTPNIQPDHVPPQATPHTDVPPTLGNNKTPNIQPDHVPPQVTPHIVVPPTLGNNKIPNIAPHIAQIGGQDTGNLTEDLHVQHGSLVAQGTLSIVDPDTGEAGFRPVTGAQGVGRYGTFTLATDGSWTYSADNSQTVVQKLSPEQHLTETLTVTAIDGTTHDITVTIQGTNDLPEISHVARSGRVAAEVHTDEDTPKEVTTSGRLTATDIDDPDKSITWQIDGPAQTKFGALTIDSKTGHWSYTLDNHSPDVQRLADGGFHSEVFRVQATDGHGGTSEKFVYVSLLGTNDAPVIHAASADADHAAVTEDAVKDTASGTLTYTDVDQETAGSVAAVHTWAVDPATTGTYGTLSVDQNGQWTYHLDNSRAATQGLAPGHPAQDVFRVTVTDGHGATDTHEVTIDIAGTRDVPLITGDTSGRAREDAVYEAQGHLTLTDPDHTGSPLELVGSGVGRYGTFTLDAATGEWHYHLDNAAAQELHQQDVAQEVFTVRTTDSTGAVTSQAVTVEVKGWTDAPRLSGAFTGEVTEDVKPVVTGTIIGTDADKGDVVTFRAYDTSPWGTFHVDPHSGEWTFTLNPAAAQKLGANDVEHVTFGVHAMDPMRTSSHHDVTITIHGADDGAHISGTAVGLVTEDTKLTAGGKLDVTDPDQGQAQFVPITGAVGAHGSFVVDADGTWSYTLDNSQHAVQALTAGHGQLTDTVTVSTIDGTSQQITVTINGSDDGAKIAGTAIGTVTEDTSQTTGGKLDVTDPDAGQAQFVPMTGAAGAHGTFTVQPDGTWSYTLDNSQHAVQALTAGGGQLTDTVTVSTIDGANQQITVTINGVDDGAKIAGTAVGTVTEDTAQTTGGKLDVTDPDAGQAQFVPMTGAAGAHGTFTVQPDGTWSYTLDNSAHAVQVLNTGSTPLTDTITVSTVDGTPHDITVSIAGTDDAPVVTSGVNPRLGGLGGVAEDGKPGDSIDGRVAGTMRHLTGSGTLTATDVDNAQGDLSWHIVGSPHGGYGTLALDPKTGDWTYTLDNGSPKIQGLIEGEAHNEQFKVAVTDGQGGTTETVVYLKIVGTNDVPVISVETSDTDHGALTEDTGPTSVTGTLTVTDPDQDGHNITGVQGAVSTTSAGHETWSVGAVTLKTTDTAATHLPTSQQGTYGTFSVDPATGQWTYTLDNSRPETQALTAGQPVQETFEVRVTDTHLATTTHTVTIDVTGAGEGAVIGGVDTGQVTEDTGLSAGKLTADGTLTVSDADPGEAAFTPVAAGAGQYGTFTLDASGHWTYTADNSQQAVQGLNPASAPLTDTLTVTSVDGTTHDITVIIEGTNDAPVVQQAGFTTTAAHSGGMTQISAQVGGQGVVAEDGTPGQVFDVHQHGVAQHFSDSGTLVATDADNAAGDLTWHVVGNGQGTYGALTLDPQTGDWTYALNNANLDVQALSAGKTKSDVFRVAVTDGAGGTTETMVVVQVKGTNDAPEISVTQGDTDTGAVTEDAARTAVSGSLTVTDVDMSTSGTGVFSTGVARAPETWSVGSATATLGGSVAPENLPDHETGTYGTLSVDQTGHWTYTLDDSLHATQGLTAGQVVQETFEVRVTDDKFGTTTHTVTIDVTGAGEGAVIGGVDTGQVTEDTGLSAGKLTADGTLTVSDADPGEAAFTPVSAGVGQYGTFTLDASGHWTYTADNSQQAVQGLNPASAPLTDTLTVTSVDGTTHDITVSIAGTDDNPVVTSGPNNPRVGGTGNVSEDGLKTLLGGQTVAAPTSASGTLTATDIDDTAGDLSWHLVGNSQGAYGSLTVDPHTGQWTYALDSKLPAVQALSDARALHDVFRVEVTDGHGGTTQTMVYVNIQGSNDIPEISVETGDSDHGAVTEDAATTTVSGTLTVSDVDMTGIASQGGAGAEAAETWSIGSTTAAHAVNGVGGVAPHQLPTQETGTYGTLTIDQKTGAWTYTLDNHLPATQALVAGKSVQETFEVRVTDDHFGTTTHTVTIDVTGAPDGAKISGTDTGQVTEDTVLSATGKLDVVDPDAGEAGFGAFSNVPGAHGTFDIAADGTWTYHLDKSDSTVQALGAGSTPLKDTFTVKSLDGTAHSVTVTINGSNDGAQIGGVDTGHVTEDQNLSSGDLTAGGQLTVSDPDPQENSFTPLSGTAGAGTYGTFTLDAQGHWTYAADDSQPAIQALGPGSTPLTDTLQVSSVDGTTHDITVTIGGSMDKPTLGASVGTAISAPGHISAEVVETGGQHILQSTGFVMHSFDFGEAYETPQGTLVDLAGRTAVIGSDAQGFGVGTNSAAVIGHFTGDAQHHSATLDTEPDPDRHHHDPQKGETLLIELEGLSKSASLTLSGFGGKGDALKWTAYDADGHSVATGDMAATDATTSSNIGTLSIETQQPFAYVAIQATTPPLYVDQMGTSSGGQTSNTHQFFTGFGVSQVQAELMQFRTPLTLVGARGDTADSSETMSWHIEGLQHGSLSAGTHNADGSWTVSGDEWKGLSVLHSGNQQITVTAIATSSGQTAESPPQTLTLDPHSAQYTVITGSPVAVTDEDNTAPLSGHFGVDTGSQAVPDFVSGDQAGQYGAFHINTDGSWMYHLDTAHAQEMTGRTFHETFTVTTTDGATKDLTVLIEGENDRPLVTDLDGGTARAPAPMVGGHLAGTDVDSPGTFVFTSGGGAHGQTIAGQYGEATVDLRTGAWTYTVDPVKAATIPAGHTMTESMTFAAAGLASHQRGELTVHIDVDPSGQAVVQTEANVFGTSDVTEDVALDHGHLATSGTLAGADAALDQIVGSHAGQFGTFDLTADGHWSYTADNALSAVQALDGGDQLTDTLTLTGATGRTYAVAVTIHGTDEAPLVAGAAVNSGTTAPNAVSQHDQGDGITDSPEEFAISLDTPATGADMHDVPDDVAAALNGVGGPAGGFHDGAGVQDGAPGLDHYLNAIMASHDPAAIGDPAFETADHHEAAMTSDGDLSSPLEGHDYHADLPLVDSGVEPSAEPMAHYLDAVGQGVEPVTPAALEASMSDYLGSVGVDPGAALPVDPMHAPDTFALGLDLPDIDGVDHAVDTITHMVDMPVEDVHVTDQLPDPIDDNSQT